MSTNAYLDYEGTQRLIDNVLAVVDKTIPTGTVLSWSGSIENIPKGWALCDGQNGTPDLRGKFIIGASEDYAIGSTGGEATHTLTIEELPAHAHTFGGVEITESTEGGSLFSGGDDLIAPGDTSETNETGEGSAFSILPPYYALAYIIKL